MKMTILLLLSTLLLCGEAFSNVDHGENARPPLPDHVFYSGTETWHEITVNAESKFSSNYYLTSPEDIDGLKAMAEKFSFIQTWFDIGVDPCDELLGWPWLGCSDSTPPRVTGLFLPSYSLHAELPVFSQMNALEIIDFSYNSLHGSIPDFLGNLPNLTQLDLSYNQLSGNIPWSIVENPNLNYSLGGNPNLEPPNKEKKNKNLGLYIGVPLGVLFGLGLPGLAVFLLTRRKPLPSPSQVMTGTECVNSNIENGSSSGISKEHLNNRNPPPTSSDKFNPSEVNELLRLHSTNNKDTRKR